MKSFLIKVAVNAVAIWVATLVVDGISVSGVRGEGLGSQILTFVLIGALFGVVNAVIKPVVMLLSFPFYVLTLGLFTFVVNALMLQITSWVASATPLTFSIDQFFWTAVLAAVVVTFVSMLLQLLIKD
jgi:Predicted membrane protein